VAYVSVISLHRRPSAKNKIERDKYPVYYFLRLFSTHLILSTVKLNVVTITIRYTFDNTRVYENGRRITIVLKQNSFTGIAPKNDA